MVADSLDVGQLSSICTALGHACRGFSSSGVLYKNWCVASSFERFQTPPSVFTLIVLQSRIQIGCRSVLQRRFQVRLFVLLREWKRVYVLVRIQIAWAGGLVVVVSRSGPSTSFGETWERLRLFDVLPGSNTPEPPCHPIMLAESTLLFW